LQPNHVAIGARRRTQPAILLAITRLRRRPLTAELRETAAMPVALLALFVAEALAWAGVPAIGAAAMGAAGVLASQGSLDLWAVLIVGTAGAELGALGGWDIGRRVAQAGLDRPGRFAERRRQALETGERVAQRWGRLLVFFVPSWVSGAIGMPFGQFAVWNVPAAFLWMIAAGLGAYGVSSAVSGGSLLDSLVPLLLAAAAFVSLALVLVRRHRRHGSPRRAGS
jgi:membrane-associated protein